MCFYCVFSISTNLSWYVGPLFHHLCAKPPSWVEPSPFGVAWPEWPTHLGGTFGATYCQGGHEGPHLVKRLWGPHFFTGRLGTTSCWRFLSGLYILLLGVLGPCVLKGLWGATFSYKAFGCHILYLGGQAQLHFLDMFEIRVRYVLDTILAF